MSIEPKPKRGCVRSQGRAQRAAGVGVARGEDRVLFRDAIGELEFDEQPLERAEIERADLQAEEMIGVEFDRVEEVLRRVLEGDLVVDAGGAQLGEMDRKIR